MNYKNMKKLTLTIEISDKSFELLKRLEKEKFAEFRDIEFDSVEEFKKSTLFKTDTVGKVRDEEWFYRRNFCDLKDMDELVENDLVDDGNGMAWHRTYYITDKGKLMLEQNKDSIKENESESNHELNNK